MAQPVKTIILGAAGRMGLTLIAQVLDDPNMTLVGGIEGPGHDALGRDLGAMVGCGDIGIPLTDDLAKLADGADAIIDFTGPAVTCGAAEIAGDAGLAHIIGTTGFTETQEAALARAAEKAVLVKSGNFSLGVNLIAGLARKVAAELDEAFDVEIIEMHHRHKVDAPSGTALLLGEAVADGRRKVLSDVSVRGRDGITGPRAPGTIGFAALRGGSVVGEHTVMFCADDERIELTHKAGDRSIFARGALTAAKWGVNKPPGLYSMVDVLSLA